MVTRRKTKPGKVALVTGAARRIGREIALALARDGWDIGVHYATSRDDAQHTVAEVEELGRRAVAVNRDLAVEAGVRSLLAECADELGPVTCVVNNASLFERDDAASFSGEQLVRAMRTNVAAPVLLAQALHDQLPPDALGVVINLLDQKLANPNPDFLSYTLSKAALQEATRLLAHGAGAESPGRRRRARTDAGLRRPERSRVRTRAHADAAGPLQHARRTSRRPSSTSPGRARSRARPCWSTAASTSCRASAT